MLLTKCELVPEYKRKIRAALQTFRNRTLMKRADSQEKVFCVGLNKTGTTSWACAMRDLGYVVGSETRATMFYYKWVKGDYDGIINYCRTDGQVFQDVPFSLPGTFRVLDAAFPGSKFVLTVRDSEEQWYDSLIKFHGKRWSPSGASPPRPEELTKALYWKRGLPADFCRDVFKTPRSDPYNRDTLLQFYQKYNAEIMSYFESRHEDFLVLNVARSGSYNQLRNFLGFHSVAEEFPWENKNA